MKIEKVTISTTYGITKNRLTTEIRKMTNELRELSDKWYNDRCRFALCENCPFYSRDKLYEDAGGEETRCKFALIRFNTVHAFMKAIEEVIEK